MNHRSTHHRSQCGFSMLEVLIATVLLVVVVLATSSYLVSANRDSKNETVREAQRATYERLRLAVESPESVTTTNLVASSMSPGNKFLYNCTGNGTCEATSSAAGNQHSLYLFAPGSADNTDPIAGPEDRPVPYSTTGERNCTPSKVNCRFGAVAYFWATCPLNAITKLPSSNCAEPMALNFRLRLVPLFAADEPGTEGSPTRYYPNPTEWAVSDYAWAYTLRMQDIRLAYTNTCPPGQVRTGTDAAGAATCRCFNRSKPDAKGACPAQNCPPNQTMVGFNNEGEIICQGMNGANKCWDVNLYGDGDCGAGAWLVRVEFGECFTGDASKGKSGSKEVTCQNDKGRCCLGAM